MKLNPYLNFDGNCEDAINYYADILDGEIKMLMHFSEAPPSAFEVKEEWKDKVMHATLEFGDGNTLLFSDHVHPGFSQGNNAHMSLNMADNDAAENVYNNLAKDGVQTVPFGPVFWGGKFGMLTDKFGVHWMVSTSH